MNCPLCKAMDLIAAGAVDSRSFFRCVSCDLVFVPQEFHPTIVDERKRYDLHDNTESNKGYLRFLSEVADIVETACPPPGRLLDYGCGKNAVLTKLLRDRKRLCDPFDPLYEYCLPSPPPGYGSIILCEVIEHCRNVRDTLSHIAALIDEKGVVVVRTQMRPPCEDLSSWWYAHDITHLNFFSIRSLEAAAEIIGRKMSRTATNDIFIIR